MFNDLNYFLKWAMWPMGLLLTDTFAANLPSQIHTLLSRLHVASSRPVGAQETALTSFSWPSREAMHSNSPSFLLQMFVVASKLALAKKLPQGDQPTLRIVLWWPSARILLQTYKTRLKWALYMNKSIWIHHIA